jgi:phage baseplate assembly protein W
LNAIQFDYPYHFDGRGRTANTSYADHVRDMIEQLLLTEPGERVNRPEFGSGLMQMVFSPNSPEVAAALEFTVQAALQQWLGDVIRVRSLDVTAVESTLTVTIEYEILQTGETRTDTIVRAS